MGRELLYFHRAMKSRVLFGHIVGGSEKRPRSAMNSRRYMPAPQAQNTAS